MAGESDSWCVCVVGVCVLAVRVCGGGECVVCVLWGENGGFECEGMSVCVCYGLIGGCECDAGW